mmetsp:Transcript_96858/g.271115  ORF Transcript_96858/g.271115 Transcript_96858/m.271115 type:complete len:217 (+) Transcript_96858:126-776(+)
MCRAHAPPGGRPPRRRIRSSSHERGALRDQLSCGGDACRASSRVGPRRGCELSIRSRAASAVAAQGRLPRAPAKAALRLDKARPRLDKARCADRGPREPVDGPAVELGGHGRGQHLLLQQGAPPRRGRGEQRLLQAQRRQRHALAAAGGNAPALRRLAGQRAEQCAGHGPRGVLHVGGGEAGIGRRGEQGARARAARGRGQRGEQGGARAGEGRDR